MKKLLLFTLVLTFLASCQGDPQKKAQREAEKLGKQADKMAGEAQDAFDKSVDKAQDAITAKSFEELNSALAAVNVPEFPDNLAAQEIAKKIGNHATDFVNSKNRETANEYSEKIQTDLEQVDSMESKGQLSADEASQIREYAQNLANAVNLQVAVVSVGTSDDSSSSDSH